MKQWVKTGIKCPALTKKGYPCPIDGEKHRNNYCHVHDPNGRNQNIIHRKKVQAAKAGSKKHMAALMKEQQLREAIALDIEEQCPVLIECQCVFHYAADIARGKYRNV